MATPVGTTLLTAPDPAPEGAAETTPDATAAADAAAPSTESAPPAPIVYEFVPPEGLQVDQALLDTVVPIFTDAQLPADKAQLLVHAYAAHVAAQQQAAQEAFTAQVQSWADAVKADPEIGAANLPKTVSAAKRVLARFGDEQVTTLLEESGLGSHPGVVRMLAKIGAATAEDTTIQSTAVAAPEKSAAELLYPSMAKKE